MLNDLITLLFGHRMDRLNTNQIENLAEDGLLTLSDIRYLARNERFVKSVTGK